MDHIKHHLDDENIKRFFSHTGRQWHMKNLKVYMNRKGNNYYIIIIQSVLKSYK